MEYTFLGRQPCSPAQLRCFRRFAATSRHEDELKSLLDQVSSLWEVLGSGLEKEPKTKILDCLDQIGQAIHDYQILGTAGVARALSAGIVLAVITQHAKSNNPATLKKFWDFIKRASALLKFAKLLAPYASRFMKLLESKLHSAG
jgi:hypothetical protein